MYDIKVTRKSERTHRQRERTQDKDEYTSLSKTALPHKNKLNRLADVDRILNVSTITMKMSSQKYISTNFHKCFNGGGTFVYDTNKFYIYILLPKRAGDISVIMWLFTMKNNYV